ncbi:NYN domain-containing protein [Tabrizicola fusiformis]|uniref:NYN domain-containing protein n=1 Tax=Tabrizicola sp. SY72 TaxID=2741673 RepID=UPI00157267B5|nr:NYN domain-containing protein [Tabrizicola sp. SY72]NTT84384.1 NYN domain-containing protein [Tabrizicola sp. SY72]
MTEFSPASFAISAVPRQRVALLVDGDNMSAAQAGKLIVQAAREGDLIIRRIYAGPNGLTNWEKTQGFHLRHAGSGKNAADLLLTVEAMEIMLTGKADVLVIASSDRDFSHLATHLRENGRRVVGIGEEKAPVHFEKCCADFHRLPEPEAVPPAFPPPPPAAAKPTSANPAKRALADQLAEVIAANATEGGLEVQQLGPLMFKKTGKKMSQHGFKDWRAFMRDHPSRFACDPKGADARVRLR